MEGHVDVERDVDVVQDVGAEHDVGDVDAGDDGENVHGHVDVEQGVEDGWVAMLMLNMLC